ncbi:Asp-tRNA(Asn)/Glu-tRNA(Gln) amidotransferase subunit GatB [Candidatus Woesebacteria bacterium]|nr:Asp-tRNA(Asn)/Glu-tRNA(Gln) amidotransferase subunit GatB [Candidatus Woesebacteria bacterium]
MMNTYEPVIGMEIHVELKTKSGMFCGCPADHFGKVPNTGTCPVCLGLPGALPIPNKKAIEWTIMLGLALGSDIAEFSKFDRKHYFYPDLPKGYQISQYDQPLCVGGKITTSFGDVRIRRVHLEEDTGKLQHATVDGKRVTLVDFNRSGVPLVEIVTEPDIHSSEQAKEFLKKLHQIVRYLGISDADMEKGSMRLEPNISIRKVGEKELPAYKVEVKNINSFRFAAAAIDFEVARHQVILESGKIPQQETRGWDEGKNGTVSQRIKEEAADYRYFPEPDIPPLRFTKEQIAKIGSSIPELPEVKRERFVKEFLLPDVDAAILTENHALSQYYEEALGVLKEMKEPLTAKDLANWLINKKVNIDDMLPAQLVESLIIAKKVVAISDEDAYKVIDSVIADNPKAVADFKAGKEPVLMFLMGKCRSQLPKVDTAIIIKLLRSRLT